MRQVQSLLRRKLEPNLYRYPGVALALQLWGIHGKKGLRKRLSTIERTDEGKTQARGHSLECQIDRAARAWGLHAHSKNQLRYKSVDLAYNDCITQSEPRGCAA